MFLNLLLTISVLLFVGVRLRSYLHIFQQEEYDGRRFLIWLWKRRLADHKVTIVIFVAVVISVFFSSQFAYTEDILKIVLLFAFLVFVGLENNPCEQAKKPLVLTQRAKRIWRTAIGLSAVVLIFFVNIFPMVFLLALGLVVLVQSLPVLLVLANVVLIPVERRIQNSFLQQAKEKLAQLQPTVIGITGSYGKTSLKHILGHILANQAPTLIAPGSVNTLMGISRTILQDLKSEHRYFVVEMGAYYKGSIKKLCDFVKPQHGIISIVGIAHLERFKTRETVMTAKSELTDAVIENKGMIVLNSDSFPESFLQQRYANNYQDFLYFGTEEKDYSHFSRYYNITQSTEGLQFTISSPSEKFTIKAPIFGEHNALNITAAVVMAQALGMAVNQIKASVKTLPQMKHRLEVTKSGNNIIIDDTYNSNPNGFISALQVLNILQQQGRRILVTPGMVELGDAHDQEHFRLGKLARDFVDVVVLIKSKRFASFIDGLGKTDILLQCFESFAEAKAWLEKNIKPHDVILYENDLPDLYEQQLKF